MDLDEEVSEAALQRRHLAAKIDKATATNRLLVISALPPPPGSGEPEQQADVWHGKAELLDCLSAQVDCHFTGATGITLAHFDIINAIAGLTVHMGDCVAH